MTSPTQKFCHDDYNTWCHLSSPPTQCISCSSSYASRTPLLVHLHTCMSRAVSSVQWQCVESLHVHLAKKPQCGGEGGTTYLIAHSGSDWLWLMFICITACHGPLLSGITAIFRNTSRFNQPGRSQSINHLPTLDHMFSSVLTKRNTAVWDHNLLKYDKNYFQTVVVILWSPTDVFCIVF